LTIENTNAKRAMDMKRVMRVTAGAVLCLALTDYWCAANSQQSIAPEAIRPEICDEFDVDGRASAPLHDVTLPPSQSCTTLTRNGFPVPDPNCTPGAVNPTLTIGVLRDRSFTTRCVRDAATKPEEKARTYDWYRLVHPANNSGESQTCELDHLISLELGGADTLDNIWPQCGPSGVALSQRDFKQKDTVENFLAMQVREGRMDLSQAQKAIATDWTQFLDEARRACPDGRCL
jgi:hypothetical protein